MHVFLEQTLFQVLSRPWDTGGQGRPGHLEADNQLYLARCQALGKTWNKEMYSLSFNAMYTYKHPTYLPKRNLPDQLT